MGDRRACRTVDSRDRTWRGREGRPPRPRTAAKGLSAADTASSAQAGPQREV